MQHVPDVSVSQGVQQGYANASAAATLEGDLELDPSAMEELAAGASGNIFGQSFTLGGE
jgi:hypothetical protein